ncbi:MAG: glutamate synthase large subunit, partial [Bacteroidota bacterium]|nr:glutamate synthase large subunit [Bacteroidota bacterium]
EKSDSASLDNVLEFLVLAGIPLPHALSMLVPESWNDKNPISDDLKAFYEYHSTFMEPWDGPAALIFSDGRYVGGLLDRNGLRPSRYVITKGDLFVMASEIGVQSFPAEQIKEKGRLRPGKILMVDTKEGRVLYDPEIKADLAQRNPYAKWLSENRVNIEKIMIGHDVPVDLGGNYNKYLQTFGYSKEDVQFNIVNMAINGVEPTGSMGNDTPLAVLSTFPQRLFTYFRQLFAQVTNPPIDPIREELVMTLTGFIGSLQQNLLDQKPDYCKTIKSKNPVITNKQFETIKNLKYKGFSTEVIPMLFSVSKGEAGLKEAIADICHQAEAAVDSGKNYIILSDRGINKDLAPIPSLLAVSAVHHYLIDHRKRMQIDIVVETAEPREVMHFALLFGFGASMVNPYMAFAILDDLVKQKAIQIDYQKAQENYIKAIQKGLLKILSKMGISTLRSYRASQIFEAIGLDQKMVDKYFTGTTSRIGGIGLEEIAREAMIPHQQAFEETNQEFLLESKGIYAYRKNGERHAWNPETISLLQWSTRTNDYKKFKEYSNLIDEKKNGPMFIRDFFELKKNPVDISKVEPASEIMKRFVTGAMSYGSISKEAHEAMAIAMNRIGGKSNTGEGGEDPARYIPLPDGTSTRSAIKQVASGRFGVTTEYLVNADEIQIKIAQGAKPGEGGQLPGHKVDKIIAKTRYSTPGITLISPPPHHDIYSIEDLAQLIFDLKNVNPRARISVKLVSEVGVGTIAAGVAKASADMILISGAEGGTGASPASSVKYAGLPTELGIADVQQTLVLNNLRGKVRLQTDGQLKTGRDIIIAALLGAEEFGFATSALIVMGCVMMRKCHMNTCPVGVATQNEELRKRFRGKADYLVNFFTFLAEEVREHLAELGYTKLDDVIGRADLLSVKPDLDLHWKARKLDLSKVLYVPKESKTNDTRFTTPQNHKIDAVLDRELIEIARPALEGKENVQLIHKIKNTDRSVGAMLSGEITKRYGADGLPDDTINFKFIGSAGQSFGAFLVKGETFRLEGDANDYLGKGLSGGKIIVVPPVGSTFKPDENIIIGNTVLYGATSGEVYISGVAGERFCVRNSGVKAVVEGAGDHCCEYMTGGRVVVLGRTGRNFAAGMSGGIAYVLNEAGNFDYFCNMGLVELSLVEEPSDIKELKDLITQHFYHTKSDKAWRILENWNSYLSQFIKVMPYEYKKVMQEEKLASIQKQLEASEEAIVNHE